MLFCTKRQQLPATLGPVPGKRPWVRRACLVHLIVGFVLSGRVLLLIFRPQHLWFTDSIMTVVKSLDVRGENHRWGPMGVISSEAELVLPTVLAMLTDEHLAFPQDLTRRRCRFYSTAWNKVQFSSSFMLFSVSFWVLHLLSYDRHGLRASSGKEKALQLHGTEVPSADANLCFLLWENALLKRVIKLRWLFFNGHQ